MLGFDKMFDLNRDGKLNCFERALEFQFMNELLKESQYDDEPDFFGDAGLDYDELEMMDADERREVLENAGLDPEDFDF